VNQPPIPRDLDEVTPQWLTAVLTRHSVLHGETVVGVRLTAYPDLRWMVMRLELTYSSSPASHAPGRMWLKLSLAEPSPGRTLLGRADVDFSRLVAERLFADMERPPILRRYAFDYEPHTDRFYILAMDPGTPGAPDSSPLPLKRAEYRTAADALARLHAFWWDHDDLPSLQNMPSAESEAGYAEEASRVLADFDQDVGHYMPDRRRALLRHLPEMFLSLAPRLLTGRNLTISHGNCDKTSFVFAGESVCPDALIIGWTYWHIDSGVHDLSTLLGQIAPCGYRRDIERHLLRRYHQQLVACGVLGYTWQDCWHDYRSAMTDVLMRGVWQWQHGLPPDTWWPTLQAAFAAYEDLWAT